MQWTIASIVPERRQLWHATRTIQNARRVATAFAGPKVSLKVDPPRTRDRRAVMRECIGTLVGTPGDDRRSDGVDRCEATLSCCPNSSAVPASMQSNPARSPCPQNTNGCIPRWWPEMRPAFDRNRWSGPTCGFAAGGTSNLVFSHPYHRRSSQACHRLSVADLDTPLGARATTISAA
jgi:hypothetical protein